MAENMGITFFILDTDERIRGEGLRKSNATVVITLLALISLLLLVITAVSAISALFFGLFFVIFLLMIVIGFYWNKYYWSHEIKNALATQKPSGLLRWKWHPYYWGKEGYMWKNYSLWVVFALVIALLWSFLLVR